MLLVSSECGLHSEVRSTSVACMEAAITAVHPFLVTCLEHDGWQGSKKLALISYKK